MIWKLSINLVRIVRLIFLSFTRLIIFLICLLGNKRVIIEWNILTINSVRISGVYVFDWISTAFLGFVLFISRMVLFYRGEYIGNDYNINRFILLVLAFVLSMAFLILRPNIIRILLGWDGLGLVSYALVIYYQNEKSANAGILTVLSNRVGDVAILLRIGLIFKIGGWNFIFFTPYLEDSSNYLLKLLVVIAAITKRAQIPFSAWLPAAIAAPTPVSALVHSSTLVTAGVYLIIRFRPALRGSVVSSYLLLISCLTIFISGLGANFEYDLKKIIALSTLRQLGVILRILSLGFSGLAFFHLLTHALFKALLFICAGVIIHRAKEYQDIRAIGGLVISIPLTRGLINLANLALCGIPFLAGFYSKDLILEVAFIRWINLVSLLLYIVSTGLTVCYTFRLVFFRLTGRWNLRALRGVADGRTTITRPMVGLGIGAIFGGAALSWIIFPEAYIICLSFTIKVIALAVSLLGGLLGYLLNLVKTNYTLASLRLYPEVVFRGSMWFIPFLSTFNFSSTNLAVGAYLRNLGDKGWSETLGGQGLFSSIISNSVLLQILQGNSVKVFIKLFITVAVLLTLFFLCFYNLYVRILHWSCKRG